MIKIYSTTQQQQLAKKKNCEKRSIKLEKRVRDKKGEHERSKKKQIILIYVSIWGMNVEKKLCDTGESAMMATKGCDGSVKVVINIEK